LYVSVEALPPLYIISPFKAVKADLVERLSNLERWRSIAGSAVKLPTKTGLRAWLRKHVGTVHTFQGREQSVVWMVLGCDQQTEGAANWACAKPNLLNVALTRAQHRFFLIGDVSLWGGKRYFDTAARVMPTITPAAFLDLNRKAR